ncbi:MAG: hypothetical protein JXB13_11980 [Phycisphaerae bacterium]|nr:hypothetical protein [Phycisphaerae bacterium]
MSQMRTIVMLGALASIITGCQEPTGPIDYTAQVFTLAGPEQSAMLWETCQDVLRQNRFALDRVDRPAGVITTYPTTSQQFFEFWRHDVNTAYDLADSSLSTVRRQARVDVTPAESDANKMRVSVVVRVQRLSSPERQFNNSATVLQCFGDELPGEAGQQRLTRADDYWIDLGRDAAMERYLLDRIIRDGSYVELASSS